MKSFLLIRFEDISGISGTGVVAEGVQFSDGICVLRWVTKVASTSIYNSVEEINAIHGHEGKTEIQWEE